MAIQILSNFGMPHLLQEKRAAEPLVLEVDASTPSLTDESEGYISDQSSDQESCQDWTKYSWMSKDVHQPVPYANLGELESTCRLLSRLPALVHQQDIEAARESLYQVALGKAFIMQGGDCAESFDDATYESVSGHMSLMAEQATILSSAMKGRQVFEIGRIAGQYAKPRSSPIETLKTGETVLTFRGENVNSTNAMERDPDPHRLVMGYIHAAARTQMISRYRQESHVNPFFTSHEALHLPLEAAFTKGVYNTSATFLWIGARTAQLDGAHLEYVRGLRNPLGLKVSPSTTCEELIATLDVLCPDKSTSWGRVALITRFGAEKVAAKLPSLIRAVQLSGHMPVWLCDPCHGNTETTTNGFKTRSVETMLKELCQTYKIHRQMRNYLGGIHLEQSGKNVTECLDSLRVKSSESLPGCYETLCDPRLARDQAIMLVNQFAEFVQAFDV